MEKKLRIIPQNSKWRQALGAKLWPTTAEKKPDLPICIALIATRSQGKHDFKIHQKSQKKNLFEGFPCLLLARLMTKHAI